MKVNVGKKDKTIRIVVGILLILIGIIYQSWWGLLGLIPLITGLINYCPLYSVLGISTHKTK